MEQQTFIFSPPKFLQKLSPSTVQESSFPYFYDRPEVQHTNALGNGVHNTPSLSAQHAFTEWQNLGEHLHQVRVLPALQVMVDNFDKEVRRLQLEVDAFVRPQLTLFDVDNAGSLHMSMCASQVAEYRTLLLTFYYMCSLKYKPSKDYIVELQ